MDNEHYDPMSDSIDLNETMRITDSESNSSDVGATSASISTADIAISENWHEPLPDEEASTEADSEFDEEEAMAGATPAAQPSG
ncbi:hypothetical protein BBJ28_00020224 [Nothophytophthora sp. Chile5]|nr:hypothetical protein BBJ28_00020224 [Nothophytophthora sp. Chile5]